eukprot:2809451-Rhodomonas_salina.3
MNHTSPPAVTSAVLFRISARGSAVMLTVPAVRAFPYRSVTTALRVKTVPASTLGGGCWTTEMMQLDGSKHSPPMLGPTVTGPDTVSAISPMSASNANASRYSPAVWTARSVKLVSPNPLSSTACPKSVSLDSKSRTVTSRRASTSSPRTLRISKAG